MFVKIIRTFGDMLADTSREVENDIGEFLVKRGDAEKIDFDAYRTATESSRNKALSEELRGEFRGMLTEFEAKLAARGGTNDGRRPQPPGTGHGVDFAALASDPEDVVVRANTKMINRVNQKIGVVRKYDPETREIISEERTGRRPEAAGLAEVMMLVDLAMNVSNNYEPARVNNAKRRLQALDGTVTEYKFNESTGQSEFIQERRELDGSVTTVKRTGTDSVSGGTTYGFVVKPEYLGNIFEISSERQVFADACEQIPMASGNEVKRPAWDQYLAPAVVGGMQQSQSFAGIDLYYASENANRTLTDANLNMINFKAVDLTAFTALSRDFIVDNYVAYDSALTRMIGRAFGWQEDWVTIQGNGVGRPQGFLNAAGALTVNRGSGNTIFLTDVQKMIQSVHPMVLNAQELRWLTNITTFQYLSTLQYSAGVFAFQPNAMTTQAMPFSVIDKSIGGTGADLYHRPMGTLSGFPLYVTEKLPVLGSTGDLCLVAPSQYGLAKRSGLEIAVSEHYYFQTDLIAYKFKIRHDGKLLWRYPYQQADGSATKLSPIVILH